MSKKIPVLGESIVLFSTFMTVYMCTVILGFPLYALWILLVSKSLTEKTRERIVAAVLAGLIGNGLFFAVTISIKNYLGSLIFSVPILILVICRIMFERQYKKATASQPQEEESTESE